MLISKRYGQAFDMNEEQINNIRFFLERPSIGKYKRLISKRYGQPA
jgi:hypothetical protein